MDVKALLKIKQHLLAIEIIIWCLIKEVYLPFKFVVGGCGIFVELDGIPSSVIRIKGE